MPGALGSQKRVLDPLELVTDHYEMPCGCWELSPLQEQRVLLPAEPSLQSLFKPFKKMR